MAGNGRILTAGAIDCHVHLICPQLMEEALASGITTIIGGGPGLPRVRGITFSKQDIGNLAQAKAANYCGQLIVMRTAGVEPNEVDRLERRRVRNR